MAVATEVLDVAAPRALRRVPWKTVAWWLLAVAVASGWVLYLRPSTLGGPAGYVIVSGSSMEPMMRTGDLAVVRRQASYGIGDVVAYRIPEENVGGGMLVIHRITGGNGSDGFVLQGDNRDHPDMWRPRTSDVAGNLAFHVPHVGTALFLLRTPLVVATAAALLGFWFIAVRGDEEDAESAAADVEPAAHDSAPPPEPFEAVRPVAPVAALPAAASRNRSLLVAVGVGAVIGLALGAATSD